MKAEKLKELKRTFKKEYAYFKECTKNTGCLSLAIEKVEDKYGEEAGQVVDTIQYYELYPEEIER